MVQQTHLEILPDFLFCALGHPHLISIKAIFLFGHKPTFFATGQKK